MDLSEWLKEDAATARYYAARLAQHGDDVRSVDWGSVQSQVQRFEVLARVGDLSNATVLDVGCGLGDLYAWLSQRGIQMRYTGVDITPQMIDACRRRFPAVDFEVANLLEAKLERRDYVFASGIFYLRQTHPLDYMRAMLARLFALCDKAVAFNSLSAWSPQREPGEFYADPAAVLDICHALTPWVVLRHDYHPRDFTVYLYRNRVVG